MGSNALSADLVLVNGKIITVDADNTVAEAVAVKMGKIIKVGTSEEVKTMAGEITTVIDLQGRSVLPGLTDAHVHMIQGGTRALDTRILDCRDFYHTEIKSIDHIIHRIREHAKNIPKGEWIKAIGSPMQNHRLKERKFPTRWDLDKASIDNPVYISFGAHITVVNSLGLSIANLTKETSNPIAGIIVKDESGELTGMLREKAQNLVTNLTVPGGLKVIQEAIEQGITIPRVSSHKFEDIKEGAKSAVQKCLERGGHNCTRYCQLS